MKKNIVFILAIVLFFGACKKWDDHIALGPKGVNETLYAQIKSQSELSVFAGYIERVHLDSLLNASKNFTVFAPTNEALSSLPDSVTSSDASLSRFLLNLFSAKAYYIRDASAQTRIKMLNGKRVLFDQDHFGEASITQGDIIAKNGVMHIIDQFVLPLPSIWEYINKTKSTYKQNAYIAALNYQRFDPTQAEIDHIDLITGQPVYKANTGIITINTFNRKVNDVASEDSLYTYIVLTDAAFDEQQARMVPYFKAKDQDTTTANAKWSIVKDLVVSGVNSGGALSKNLVSKFGVHLKLDPSSIVATKQLSNGVVYVVNALSAELAEKIPVVYIQGEHPIGFSSQAESALEDIFYRKRYNPVTKDTFNDIYVNRGSSGANFYVDYATSDLFTTTYKVYWVALNDYVSSGQDDGAYGTTENLNQIVQVMKNDTLSTVLFNETGTVEPYVYTETYIGEFTNDAYNWLLSYPDIATDDSFSANPATKFIRLQAPSSNSSPYNLTLDYLKFVPVFN